LRRDAAYLAKEATQNGAKGAKTRRSRSCPHALMLVGGPFGDEVSGSFKFGQK
jgi:hypothetical protein